MSFKKVLFAAAMLVAAVGAQAQSANFGLTGIITTAACTIAMTTNGGIADYGTMASGTVKALTVYAGKSYLFHSTNIAYNVGCTAPTKIDLLFADTKTGATFPLDGSDLNRYGITDGQGTVGIGAYAVRLTGTLIDGATPAGYLMQPRTNTAVAWANTGPTALTAENSAPGYATGFRKTIADTMPAALTTLSGTLEITPFLSKVYVDAATNSITMNGAGTVTLQYL